VSGRYGLHAANTGSRPAISARLADMVRDEIERGADERDAAKAETGEIAMADREAPRLL
jgi:hypothetical protein